MSFVATAGPQPKPDERICTFTKAAVRSNLSLHVHEILKTNISKKKNNHQYNYINHKIQQQNKYPNLQYELCGTQILKVDCIHVLLNV